MALALPAHPDTPPVRGRPLPLFALLGANGVSIVGNFMTLVALPWFVLVTTGSVAKTGVIAVAVTLPQVLAGCFAGSLVDRLGYRRTSVLADLTAGASVALVPLLAHGQRLAFWQLAALVFLGNLLNAPGATARQSMLPDLIALAAVPRDRANAWYQAIFNATALVGPLLAGLAIPAVGAGNVLFLDAASFAASALAVGCGVPAGATRAGQAGVPYARQLREGLGFIGRDRLLGGMILTATAVSLIGPAFFTVILPLFARERYGTALALGLLRAGWGAGALAGTVLYGLLAGRLARRATYALAYALGLVPFALILAAPPAPVAATALLLAAVALAPVQPLRLTIQQERTPEALRSRVFGTGNAVQFVAAPLGTVVFSAVAAGHGALVAIAAMWLVWAGIAVAVGVSPVFRLMDAPGPSRERAADPGAAAPSGALAAPALAPGGE
ncbi:MAG TPA: MFS transporter [Thermomicrobiales bacterium]|nr:MFS transporter [Thermomicrobiales bacterium]